MFKYHILPSSIFFVFLSHFFCPAKIAFCIKNYCKINISITLYLFNYCKSGIRLLVKNNRFKAAFLKRPNHFLYSSIIMPVNNKDFITHSFPFDCM